MKMLMNPNKEILAILKEQSVFKATEYRLLNNCLIEDIDGGKILFNGLTRACIWLTNAEYRELLDKDKMDYFLPLYRYYFLVPVDYPEMEIIDLVREQFKPEIDDAYLNHPESYTILTTTKCNARCFYCYEHKAKKKNMSENTAEKVADWIMNHSYRNIPVGLNWFGGEPLFNQKVINIITNKLRNNGFKFVSSFTSNGYLFDEATVNKAKTMWNTDNVQITIDGTEHVYNKAKNYIYKKGISPYKKVLNNIALLLNAEIKVTIRMNVDVYNGENLKELIKEIHDTFGNHPLLYLYCYPIFEDDTYQRTEEERQIVFNTLSELEQLMDDVKLGAGTAPTSVIMSHQCMVDNGRSITVSPDGEFGLCEHFIDSDFWGSVNSDKVNPEVWHSWKEYEKPMDICNDCPLYGSCLRPSKCVEMSKCDKYYKEWKIQKAKTGLRRFYSSITNNIIPNQYTLPTIKEDPSLKQILKTWIKNKLD